MSAYRPGQGTYARAATAAAFMLLALFASWRLHVLLPGEQTFTVLGMTLPRTAVWAAAVFVVLGAVVLLFTVGYTTGVRGLDERAHKAVDLLIDTESELGKVSWPTGEELTRSTTAVLVAVVLLTVFLVAVDSLLVFAMTRLQVLPR